jgi:hypothetical protein
MTTFPPYFLHLSGKLPLGTICRVVPKQILRSATLQKNVELNLTKNIKNSP